MCHKTKARKQRHIRKQGQRIQQIYPLLCTSPVQRPGTAVCGDSQGQAGTIVFFFNNSCFAHIGFGKWKPLVKETLFTPVEMVTICSGHTKFSNIKDVIVTTPIEHNTTKTEATK